MTENTTRLTVEAAYGARKVRSDTSKHCSVYAVGKARAAAVCPGVCSQVSQKFFPYLDFELSPRTRELATPRQLRLLGEHPLSNYG